MSSATFSAHAASLQAQARSANLSSCLEASSQPAAADREIARINVVKIFMVLRATPPAPVARRLSSSS
jgi:hypothetical protein